MSNFEQADGLTTKLVRGRRHYVVDGVEYPSVTTILQVVNKPGLVGWMRKNAELAFVTAIRDPLIHTLANDDQRLDYIHTQMDYESNNERDVGVGSHQFLDHLIKGTLQSLAPEYQALGYSFHKWLVEHEIQLKQSEVTVISRQHRYAGTLDVVGFKHDGYVLLDWKTSKSIYPEMALQLAAYSVAFQETYHLPVQEAWVVRFGRGPVPDYEARRVDVPWAFSGFLGALALSNSLADSPNLWHKG